MKLVRKELLLIEDDKIDQKAFKRFTEKIEFPYNIDICGSVEEAKKSLKLKKFDIIVSDYFLGDGTVFDVMEGYTNIPWIIITGVGNDDFAVKALKLGAYDYLIKDNEGSYLNLMPLIVENATKRFRAEHELNQYHENLEKIIEERTSALKKEIIEHNLAEEALREREERLVEAQKIAKLGHYAYDIKNNTWSSSIELDNIFGITKKYKRDLNSWLNFIHPDYKETIQNYMTNHVLKKHLKFNKEYKIINFKTKEQKWVHDIGNLKFDKDKNLIGMFGTIQDITEIKKTNLAIQSSEERLKILFEFAPDGYFLVDMEGTFLDGNKAIEDITGYKREELIGINIFEINILNTKNRARAFKYLTKKIVNQGPQEFTLNRKRGGKIYLEVQTYPTEINGKTVILGIARDISKRKITEKELEKYREHLEELVNERTAELESKNAELRRMNKLFVGREFRIKELKDMLKKVN